MQEILELRTKHLLYNFTCKERRSLQVTIYITRIHVLQHGIKTFSTKRRDFQSSERLDSSRTNLYAIKCFSTRYQLRDEKNCRLGTGAEHTCKMCACIETGIVRGAGGRRQPAGNFRQKTPHSNDFLAAQRRPGIVARRPYARTAVPSLRKLLNEKSERLFFPSRTEISGAQIGEIEHCDSHTCPIVR